MSKLYLIRHGQTDWNAMRRIQGSIDRPLNEEGRAQAEKLAERFSNESISAIYSSPLSRAKETAEIINRHHMHEIRLEDSLREGSFGSAEGLTWHAFRVLYEKELEQIKKLPIEQRIRMAASHGGESNHDIAERVLPVLKKAVLEHPSSSLIFVCHGWVIRSILIVLFGVDDRTVSVENGGYILLENNDESFSLLKHEGVKIDIINVSLF